ncbi:UDP-N-acetylmuramoyl-L-alanyl-D-glutamate--2,6-diaminopimelate ligase [Pontibacillus yanchengensis]|uniref:UDP-N-acetylmuramoyl-L-alanyl-D-glutamate--2,6-diaminopimelate ligase n=2 Tax=Pontibacillus yanchengensis TaxID=462910 RepID=A0A6I4ZS50_9BACI|nr:UDP-N-acetylmuramoyl-L-alanyl-D-glutamate--2,6-diaminopimelate ligase [Pontibacillus yanchengensis]MYL33045.1 UDP-N-acetylmuramoyl-L-alanyl-D-glutamate--2,6-diaminopimelate ligase [Pontibacillus yanchengensis]MYL52105.1 UDP-N-acetylmuramoyl-L-alanyl-D-glutamate--2,6-diaminopimelate ligase [Pontibacillus yanchengensis]
MKLTNLIKTLRVYQTTKSIEHIDVTGLEMDSRAVQSGNVFICINGYTVDGHDFAKQAEEKGANAIVAERPLPVSIPVIIVNDSQRAMSKLANYYYNHPTQQFRLIGVTGTNGKTTISYLIESIFQTSQQQTGLVGTIQMKIGEEEYEVKNTTPDALFLQKNFAKMVDQKVDTAVMEVSSHALDLGRVHGCDFDVAVFTNLSQDHLDFHKDMDDYLRAKSLLFSQLGNAYESNPKYAVLNQDDPHYASLMKSTAQEVITYGIDSEADITAKQLHLSAQGTEFILKTPDDEIEMKSSLIGRFSVYNMLAAASAAWVSGVSLQTIKQAFENTKGVSGRFEPVLSGQDFGVIVDYAHTPDSLENVLQTVKSFASRRIFVVVGCGGDRDKKKRPLMAQVAVKYADQAIFTSDNPRSEDPASIIADMETGVETGSYVVIKDRKEAIQRAIEQAQTSDVVVIAGKGHETYQEVNGHTIHFDDREVARESILGHNQ